MGCRGKGGGEEGILRTHLTTTTRTWCAPKLLDSISFFLSFSYLCLSTVLTGPYSATPSVYDYRYPLILHTVPTTLHTATARNELLVTLG